MHFKEGSLGLSCTFPAVDLLLVVLRMMLFPFNTNSAVVRINPCQALPNQAEQIATACGWERRGACRYVMPPVSATHATAL